MTKQNSIQGDPAELNRGLGQEIVGDVGAPTPGLDPAAGGDGAGGGNSRADLPTEHDRSRGGPR